MEILPQKWMNDVVTMTIKKELLYSGCVRWTENPEDGVRLSEVPQEIS